MSEQPRRRIQDEGFWCRFAVRCSEGWDWIDKRAIDKHFVSLSILSGTIILTHWAMEFAYWSSSPGLEVAAIIAAVVGPYSALQAAAIAFYFRARQ